MFSPVPSPVQVTTQEAVCPPAEAVMVTGTESLPLYTLVTLPNWSTVAMSSLLLDHSTVTWASAGVGVAESWKGSPAARGTSVRLRVRASRVTFWGAETLVELPPVELSEGLFPNSRGDRVVMTITTAAMIRTRDRIRPPT